TPSATQRRRGSRRGLRHPFPRTQKCCREIRKLPSCIPGCRLSGRSTAPPNDLCSPRVRAIGCSDLAAETPVRLSPATAPQSRRTLLRLHTRPTPCPAKIFPSFFFLLLAFTPRSSYM